MYSPCGASPPSEAVEVACQAGGNINDPSVQPARSSKSRLTSPPCAFIMFSLFWASKHGRKKHCPSSSHITAQRTDNIKLLGGSNSLETYITNIIYKSYIAQWVQSSQVKVQHNNIDNHHLGMKICLRNPTLALAPFTSGLSSHTFAERQDCFQCCSAPNKRSQAIQTRRHAC